MPTGGRACPPTASTSSTTRSTSCSMSSHQYPARLPAGDGAARRCVSRDQGAGGWPGGSARSSKVSRRRKQREQMRPHRTPARLTAGALKRGVCVLACASLTVVASQQAHAQRPPFESSVEVASLDATVLDDRGQPVSGLQPSDFAVRIDGDARRVISAEWCAQGARRSAPSGPARRLHQQQRSSVRRTADCDRRRSAEHPIRRRHGDFDSGVVVPRSAGALRPRGRDCVRSGRLRHVVYARSRAHQTGDCADERPRAIDERHRGEHGEPGRKRSTSLTVSPSRSTASSLASVPDRTG